MREGGHEGREKMAGGDPRRFLLQAVLWTKARTRSDTLHSQTGRCLLLCILRCKERMILLFHNYKHQRQKKEIFTFREPQGTLEVLCVAKDFQVV